MHLFACILTFFSSITDLTVHIPACVFRASFLSSREPLRGIPPVSSSHHFCAVVPWRITVLGARAEARLPLRSWLELCAIFPEAAFDIHLVGPEVSFWNV